MREVFQQFAELVTNVGVEVGVSVRTQNVIASTDKDARQIANNIIATCEDLLHRFPWRRKIGDDPWVLKEDGSYTYVLHDDSDQPMFDARLIIQGAKWRYLYGKGLTYGEAFRDYERRINEFAFFYNGIDTKVDTNDVSATG